MANGFHREWETEPFLQIKKKEHMVITVQLL